MYALFPNEARTYLSKHRAVSYTHLDVYKRQEKRAAGAPSHAGPATDTSSAAAAGSATAAGGPAPKKRPKRGWIVAGVVAAVIVVAGAGFWVWHEQPSFCNAICHSPMDYYVETYDSGDPQLGVTVHAKAGESCLDCHTAELTTQISEAMAWVSDNYPMTEDGTCLLYTSRCV